MLQALQRQRPPTAYRPLFGQRTKKFGFDYSDIFSNHMVIFLHGGDCTEDINEHLRGHLQSVKDFKTCSADTVLRGIKELSTQTDEIQSESKVWHQFNINQKLNGLMTKSLLLTGQLRRGNQDYTFDYDNQVIATEKYDSQRTYKKFDGYQPGIGSIGKLVVVLFYMKFLKEKKSCSLTHKKVLEIDVKTFFAVSRIKK